MSSTRFSLIRDVGRVLLFKVSFFKLIFTSKTKYYRPSNLKVVVVVIGFLKKKKDLFYTFVTCLCIAVTISAALEGRIKK